MGFIEFLKTGGIEFMGFLTFLLCGIILLIGMGLMMAFKKKDASVEKSLSKNNELIKSISLFALVFGILGQLIGLYSAFDHISEIGGVSPEMLAGGLKVSMLTTLYGIGIFLFSRLCILLLGWAASRE